MQMSTADIPVALGERQSRSLPNIKKAGIVTASAAAVITSIGIGVGVWLQNNRIAIPAPKPRSTATKKSEPLPMSQITPVSYRAEPLEEKKSEQPTKKETSIEVDAHGNVRIIMDSVTYSVGETLDPKLFAIDGIDVVDTPSGTHLHVYMNGAEKAVTLSMGKDDVDALKEKLNVKQPTYVHAKLSFYVNSIRSPHEPIVTLWKEEKKQEQEPNLFAPPPHSSAHGAIANKP